MELLLLLLLPMLGVTIISGTRGTGNITPTRRKLDVPDEIFLLQPDAAPLVQILSQAKKKQAINPEISWFEDDLLPQRDQVGTTTTADETSITISNTGYFYAGDVIKVEATGEIMLCTTHTNTVLTVSRGWGETTKTTISGGAYLLKLGNANEEGSGVPTLRSTTVSKVRNYLQIFKTPFGVTETEEASDLYGGGDLSYLRMKKLVEHKIQMERALLFGELKEDTDGDHPKRATRGLLKFIVGTNTQAAGGTLTEAEFETFLETGFMYGSTTKTLLASPKVISAINYWGKNALQMLPKDKTYGLSVMRYLSSHGEVLLIRHKLLQGTIYGGYAFLLDMNNLFYRFLKGRDTKLQRNIQDPDEDQEKDQYITEAGLELRNPETHSVLTGVSSYE